MSVTIVMSMLIVGLLLVYLSFALLKPEWFS